MKINQIPAFYYKTKLLAFLVLLLAQINCVGLHVLTHTKKEKVHLKLENIVTVDRSYFAPNYVTVDSNYVLIHIVSDKNIQHFNKILLVEDRVSNPYNFHTSFFKNNQEILNMSTLYQDDLRNRHGYLQSLQISSNFEKKHHDISQSSYQNFVAIPIKSQYHDLINDDYDQVTINLSGGVLGASISLSTNKIKIEKIDIIDSIEKSKNFRELNTLNGH